MQNTTLVLDLSDWRPPLVDGEATGPTLRRPLRRDVPEIGELYFASYEPRVGAASMEDAVADIESSWDGAYGELWQEASVVAELDGRIVGVLLVVREAPWEGTPTGPFIIELFVSPTHRRRGLARRLLIRGIETLADSGAESVGLRVLVDNEPAVALYRSLGFVGWQA